MLNFNRDSFFVLALFVLVCPWIATCQEGGDGEPVEPLSGYNFAGSDHSDDTAYTALPSDRGTIHDPSWVYDSLGEATLGGNDRGSIRCKGYYPSAFAGVGPASENNINSLAELCADQAFGGGMWRQGRRATSNGAFCAWFLSPPTLVFSRQTSARLSLDDWHRWMFCQTKCTCQHEAAIPMMASVSEMLIDSMRPLYRDSFPQVISIVQGGYPTSYYEPNSVRHAIPLVSMPNGMSSPPINIRGIHLRKGIVSGAIINQLYCEGERPAWLDAIVRRYFTTQRLCAATFLGGQPNANAGGFCYDPDKNAFAFKEEFTSPIYAQTPSSANAYEANTQPPNEDELSAEENTFVVHLWCRVHCACKAPRKNGVVNKPSNTIRGYGEANWKNGEFTFTSLPRSPGAPPAIETLLGSAPLAPGEAPKSNRCSPSADGKSQICINRLKRPLVYPPEPENLPTITPVDTVALDLRARLPSCGASCKTNLDCSSQPRGAESCRCVVKSTRPERQSYDGGRGAMVRLAIAASCMTVSRSLRSGLGGGRVRRWERELCVCNATYVSEGCCGSASGNGLVWEDGGRRWGVLWGNESAGELAL